MEYSSDLSLPACLSASVWRQGVLLGEEGSSVRSALWLSARLQVSLLLPQVSLTFIILLTAAAVEAHWILHVPPCTWTPSFIISWWTDCIIDITVTSDILSAGSIFFNKISLFLTLPVHHEFIRLKQQRNAPHWVLEVLLLYSVLHVSDVWSLKGTVHLKYI